MTSKIASPIGKGFKGLPIDIISLRTNLARLNKYNQADEKDVFDKSLEKAIKDFQQDEGLQIDGVVRPNGETERALNRLLEGKKNAFEAKPAKVKITNPIGYGKKQKEKDIEQIQQALATLDYIPKSRGFEPNGILDALTLRGIREFQRQAGLYVDGKLMPDGETEKALNIALKKAVNSEIEEEELPEQERNIPGTDIPDKGIPEDAPNGPIYSEEDGVPPVEAEVPDPDMDPQMERDPDSWDLFPPEWET